VVESKGSPKNTSEDRNMDWVQLPDSTVHPAELVYETSVGDDVGGDLILVSYSSQSSSHVVEEKMYHPWKQQTQQWRR
jgi:hypothetical protein